MNVISNYHTHMYLCHHAKGDVKDYVEEAINKGFKYLGISDHNPIQGFYLPNNEYDQMRVNSNMSMDDFYNIYIPNIEDCQKKYGDKIKLYKALECEYLREAIPHLEELSKHTDYLILAVHFFRMENHLVNSFFDLNYTNVIEYGKIAVEALNSGYFKIFAHPDLFIYQYKDKFGEYSFDEKCEEVSRMICEAAEKNDVILEINANGFRKKEDNNITHEIYPNSNFFRIAKEYEDLKFVVSSDAHKPSLLLDEYVYKGYKFGEDLGLNILGEVEL